jgi:hypothetical protein
MASSLADTIKTMGASVFGGGGAQPRSSPAAIQAAASGNTGIVPPSMQTGANGAPAAPQAPKPPTMPMTTKPPAGGGIAPLASESVTAQFNKITAQGGPLMDMAAQTGLNSANKRGLLNSSMAVGASQAEAYRAALPLAQQEAQTAAARNTQQRDIEAQASRQTTAGQQALEQIGAQGGVAKELAGLNNVAEMSRLQTQLSSAESQQGKEIAAQMERLQADAAGQMSRLQAQLAGADAQQAKEIQAQMDRLRVSTDADMAHLNEQGRQALAQIGAQGQVQTDLATINNQAELTRLQTSLASSESQQGKAIAAEMERLKTQLASADSQQKAEIEAQMGRLVVSGQQELDRLKAASGFEQDRVRLQGTIESALSSQGAEQTKALATLQGELQSKLQGQTDTAAFQRLNAQFEHDLTVVDKQNAADIDKLKASGDQNMRQLLQQQEGSLKELSIQLAAGDRQKIAELTVSIFEKEAAMRAALLSNTAMPASERAGYERAISSMGDPVRAYINQLYTPPPAAPGGGIAPTNGGTPTDNPIITAPGGGAVADAPGGYTGGGTGIAPTAGFDSYVAPQPVLNQPAPPLAAAGGGIQPQIVDYSQENGDRERLRQQLGILQ